MKTLDEVIKAIEYCTEIDDYCCECCPGFEEPDCYVPKDALQYLKEFQGLSKMWNDKLDTEQENPPLTWDELKQMEGKPVWIEMDGYKPSWGIVMNQDKRNGRLMLCGYDEAAIRIEINEEGEGNGWQAYRKERE